MEELEFDYCLIAYRGSTRSQVTFNAHKYTNSWCSYQYSRCFEVTRSLVQSLYQRIKFSPDAATTLRPVITRPLWAEVRSQFLHEITDKFLQHNIPDEIIINVDQTASKFVTTNNFTTAAKGEKHISRAGATEKRAITVTLCESLDGCMLPFQLIYAGKTERSLPEFTFPDGFCLAFNQRHWSNETETICLAEDLFAPYI